MVSLSRLSRVAVWWMILSLGCASGAVASRAQEAKPKPPAAEAKPVKPSKDKPKALAGKAKGSRAAEAASSKKGTRREEVQAQGKGHKGKRPKKARAGEEETLVLALRQVSAEWMAHHVKRLFSGPEPVRVSADEPGNVLLVRAHPDVLEQIRQMVKLLEQATAKSVRHTERKVRIFRMNYADAQRVGALISELAPFGPNGPPPQVEWDLRTNTLLINARQEDWPEIETVIGAVDRQD